MWKKEPRPLRGGFEIIDETGQPIAFVYDDAPTGVLEQILHAGEMYRELQEHAAEGSRSAANCLARIDAEAAK